jgi:hypothetical protein
MLGCAYRFDVSYWLLFMILLVALLVNRVVALLERRTRWLQ